MSLPYYILRRLSQALPLLLGVIVINFLIIHAAPGDPVLVIVGEYGTTTEYMDMMRAKLGLDKPLYLQLLIYLKTTLLGDLGYSFVWEEPVLKIILEFVPATLLLMGASLIISTFFGITIGVWTAKAPDSFKDVTIRTMCLAGYSIPVFWMGTMAILLFSVHLEWLPAQGMKTIASPLSGFSYYWDIARHLIMPAAVLGVSQLALTARMTRASMLEVMGQDFIITAWSKGLSTGRVLYRHGLGNALLPIVTIIGMQAGYMFGGTILTETVFGWPGLGRLMLRAIGTRDYPLMMGMFIVITVMVSAANLIADIVYALLDPRVRYSTKR
jgi:peptide/nickel transport system permease protein